ncbi:large ribosomal subunit protein eL13A [Diutina catenulata]
MAIAKNYALQKAHFRKSSWQSRVKVHFNQATSKVSRRVHRASKAAKLAPRPIDALRPIVRAPTIKYNRKVRAGRGFTLAELKAAGLSAKYARTIGIAVDHRRQNKSTETFDANVQRLKEYLSKLVIFDKKTTSAEIAQHQQASTAATFPVEQPAIETAPRAVEARDQSAYRTLRLARSDKKYKGIREKRAREKAEAEAEKKKK